MPAKKWFIVLSCLAAFGSFSLAENPQQTPIAAEESSTAGVPDKKQLYSDFSELLSGVKLVGRFTTLGNDDGPAAKEEYTIHSATKLPQGDYWLITARIKYGHVDLTIPMPLEIKWAGDTPVITLTKLTLPGLGTFSSRVLIYNDKYVGTWTHGEVGGHLFGILEKVRKEEPAP